jgi:hypothetical protein
MNATPHAISERWELLRELMRIPTDQMSEDEREACMATLIADQKLRGIA